MQLFFSYKTKTLKYLPHFSLVFSNDYSNQETVKLRPPPSLNHYHSIYPVGKQ